MKFSAKTRLALLFLFLACFFGVVTSLVVEYLVSRQIINEAQERVKEDLNTARWVYETNLRDIERVVRWGSRRHVLKAAIKKRRISAISEEYLQLMAEEGLDFLTVVDRKGKVIARFHNPQSSGDSLVHDPFVRSGLRGSSLTGTQVLPRNELLKDGDALAQRAYIRVIATPKERPSTKIEEASGLLMKASYPVYDFDGSLLGVIFGGKLLNRNYEVVDRIKNIVFKDARYKGKEIGTATIFLDDVRISTNVIDREGNRAIGTRVSAEVYAQIFDRGEPWIQRAFVVDDWYITAYEPIRDVEGKIVGILYVGMLESKYAMMKERLVLLFFLFSMCAMLAALAISFMLSWKTLKGKVS